MFEDEKAKRFKEFYSAGEETVRHNLITNQYKISEFKTAHAQEWIRLKEEARALEAASKRSAREEETLSIAKEANRLASEANSIARREAAAAARSARWAMYAAVIAAIMAIISMQHQIFSTISRLLKI